MEHGDFRWGCELSDVLISRGTHSSNPFELSIPILSLSPELLGSNKLPIMGVSGAGKSTLLNLIAAIEWPHTKAGNICWTFPDGKKISWGLQGPDSGQLKLLRQKYFGFSFQSSTLIPHLTIEENLSYPLENCGNSREESRIKALEFLESVIGSDAITMLQQYPHQLSGGEKQRVALIQSIVHDPSVLFADEPTGSLDVNTRRIVMDVLVRWVDAAPGKRFLIWVTHHDDDPMEHKLERKLSVSDGGCRWQLWREQLGEWENEDALD